MGQRELENKPQYWNGRTNDSEVSPKKENKRKKVKLIKLCSDTLRMDFHSMQRDLGLISEKHFKIKTGK